VWWYAPMAYGGSYPKWAFHNRRGRNVNGTAATTTGGWAGGNFGGTDVGGVLYNGGASTADVAMLYFRSPYEVEHFYGTWSNGWPLMEDMTLGGISRPSGAYRFDNDANRVTAANVTVEFGGGPSTGNYTLTYDRWRVTAWD